MASEYIRDIVREHLQREGYDGLYNADGDCACEVADLSPGVCMSEYCKPGMRAACTCGGHDWHMVARELAQEGEK